MMSRHGYKWPADRWSLIHKMIAYTHTCTHTPAHFTLIMLPSSWHCAQVVVKFHYHWGMNGCVKMADSSSMHSVDKWLTGE